MAKTSCSGEAPQIVSSVTPYLSSKRETYTIWMKSLVCNTNGCTVYDSNGEIVYRVDNYDKKCSNEVLLMNLQGKLLYTIRKKRLQAFERWDGYKWSGSCEFDKEEEKPWFHVKSYSRLLMGSLACQITLGFEKYRIVRLTGKTTAGFKIVDIHGGIVAEVRLTGKEETIIFWNSSGGGCIIFGDEKSYGPFTYNGYYNCLWSNLSQNVISSI